MRFGQLCGGGVIYGCKKKDAHARNLVHWGECGEPMSRLLLWLRRVFGACRSSTQHLKTALHALRHKGAQFFSCAAENLSRRSGPKT